MHVMWHCSAENVKSEDDSQRTPKLPLTLADGEEINRRQGAEGKQTLYMPVRMTVRLRMKRAARDRNSLQAPD
jgi:hypothetical protein